MKPKGQQGAQAFALGMVAGETSGDLLASAVLSGLMAHKDPECPVAAAGIGGPAMRAQGFEAWWPSETLAVRGYVEVLRAYPRLRSVRRQVLERMQAWKPDVFVGVDAPDFNLDLECALRRSGTKVAHFISPSIWAWRGRRIDLIRRAVDQMLVVFPFEEEMYRAAGIAATYVGHPLADVIPMHADRSAARMALGVPQEASVVAVLPGSRVSEVTYLGPVFLETIAWLAQRRPDVHFVVPAATERLHTQLRALCAAQRIEQRAQVHLVSGASHHAIAAANAVLVASGTATLEVALFRRPMVIAYRMAWATYALMKHMAYLPWIGLPNILCRETLVPEFIQDAATPLVLGQAVLAQLEDPVFSERLAARFEELHQSLRRGCAQRAAEALWTMRQGVTG
jgi:lipid-A-disaccharide synthase